MSMSAMMVFSMQAAVPFAHGRIYSTVLHSVCRDAHVMHTSAYILLEIGLQQCRFLLTPFVAADRAEVYIDAAQQEEPDSLGCAFIKFKIVLQQGQTDAAIQQIQRMQSLEDFSPDFIRVGWLHQPKSPCYRSI